MLQKLWAPGQDRPRRRRSDQSCRSRSLECSRARLSRIGFNELGRDEEAIKEAERAIELNPADSAAHLDLAISAKRSDPERAIVEARRAIELGPENSLAYQLLINCLFESRRDKEVAEFGREWLAVTPYDAAAHSALGSAMAENGDLVSAARHVGYVMMLRPEVEASACRSTPDSAFVGQGTGWVAAVARDRCKCPGLATNAGRTRVVTRDVS